MNIFILHEDPVQAAQYQCDKHVVKMIVEYAQLMSTAHRIIDGTEWEGRTTKGHRIRRFFHPDPDMQESLYKACHLNHPSARWVRQSAANYGWLYEMWVALCHEYTHRYGRKHLTQLKLEYTLLIPPLAINAEKRFTQPTPAMAQFPHCIVEGDSLASYRQFYWEDKYAFAKWTNRPKPEWWIKYEWERRQTETILG